MALGQRIATFWVVKMFGTTLGISGFFVVYFWVMHNPLREPTVMPLTPLDHWVGVNDEAMMLYGSLWFYISLAPAFAVDWSQYPSLQFLKATDAGGNAFPSLHVAFAVFSAMVLARQLRSVRAPAWVRALNLLWALGIVYSTLATRQHVLLDVLGGTLLAFAVGWAGNTRGRLVWKEA